MSERDTETNSGGTYSAGNADFGSTTSGTTNADNGLSENSEGMSRDAETNETVSVDSLLTTITEQNNILISLDVVLIVAVFICAGALCVRTLVKAFEV